MTKLSLPMAGYSPTIADFDNDGWKDVCLSRGMCGGYLRLNRIWWWHSPTLCFEIWAA